MANVVVLWSGYDVFVMCVCVFSLQDWKQGEIGTGNNVHKSLEAEQQRREQVLDIRQALAREVTQRSKQVAGALDTLNY